MNRKLLLFDVVLLGLVIYAGVQLHNQWLAEKAREAANLHHNLPPTPPPPFSPLASPPAVLPSGYASIAQKTLLDRSRNSDIVVEVVPPPPPVPVPPLPVYHGMMDLGDGPMAILSATGVARQQMVHVNEDIGPFKLVGLNTREITLEWQGHTIHKVVDDIAARSAGQQDSAPIARTEAPPPVVAAPVIVQSAKGPGQDTGRGQRICTPGDTYPAGAVVDGFRKVLSKNPFGEACFWEPLSR